MNLLEPQPKEYIVDGSRWRVMTMTELYDRYHNWEKPGPPVKLISGELCVWIGKA